MHAYGAHPPTGMHAYGRKHLTSNARPSSEHAYYMYAHSILFLYACTMYAQYSLSICLYTIQLFLCFLQARRRRACRPQYGYAFGAILPQFGAEFCSEHASWVNEPCMLDWLPTSHLPPSFAALLSRFPLLPSSPTLLSPPFAILVGCRYIPHYCSLLLKVLLTTAHCCYMFSLLITAAHYCSLLSIAATFDHYCSLTAAHYCSLLLTVGTFASERAPTLSRFSIHHGQRE